MNSITAIDWSREAFTAFNELIWNIGGFEPDCLAVCLIAFERAGLWYPVSELLPEIGVILAFCIAGYTKHPVMLALDLV